MITAAQVKELRETTGAGMMDCKNALVEMQGDMEAAIKLMREKGQMKADKKSDRVTAEGAIIIANAANGQAAVALEVNSETDFVARQADFMQFAEQAAQVALEHKVTDVAALADLKLPSGQTVEEARKALVAKIGENIQIRRMAYVATSGGIGAYVHNGRIGVLVEINPSKLDLAKDIAMHIAAFNPQALRPADVSAELIENEKAIFRAQAAESGKPAEVIEKMITGRINKFLNEMSLYGQAFARDQDKTIAQLLKDHQADVLSFVRLEVGEGVEKKVDNFAEEVRALQGA